MTKVLQVVKATNKKSSKTAQNAKIQKNSTVQFKILKIIAIRGSFPPDMYTDKDDKKMTMKESSKLVDAQEESVLRAIKKLSERKLIGLIKEEKQSGGSRKFYGLTDDGIELLVHDGNLTLEEFWSLIFNFFNSEYRFRLRNIDTHKDKFEKEKKKLTVSIDKVFQEYEMTSLKIQRDFFTGVENLESLDSLGHVYDSKSDKSHYQTISIILNELLNTNERLTKKDILKQIRKITDDKEFLDRGVDSISEEFDEYRIKNKTYYKISIDGILLLFLYYYEMMTANYHATILKNRKSGSMSDVLILKKLRHIVKNYEDSLPMIFKNWDKLRKLIETEISDLKLKPPYPPERELLKYIIWQFSDKDNFLDKIFSQDDLSPLAVLYHTEKYFPDRFRSEYEKGKLELCRWIDDAKLNPDLIFSHHGEPSGFITQHIDYDVIEFFKKDLNVKQDEDYHIQVEKIKSHMEPLRKFFELGSLVITSNRSTMMKGTSIQKSFVARLQNRLSFCFYIMLKKNVGNDRWVKFLSTETTGTRPWLQGWFDFISGFEKNNLERINKVLVKA